MCMCVKSSFIGCSYSFYAVVVVCSRTPDANQAVYIDAEPYVSGASYYIAAAWARENISRVPSSLTVGDGSTTLANMVVYRNAELSSDTDYSIFVRIDIESDAGPKVNGLKFMVNHTKSIIPLSLPQPIRIYSEYLMVRTGKMLRNLGNNH